MRNSTSIITLAIAIAAGHSAGTPFYNVTMPSPTVKGPTLYHHSGFCARRPKTKTNKRKGFNQRQIRKDRRRAASAGFKNTFA